MTGTAIRQRTRRVDATLAEKFRQIPVANVSDVMGRLYGGDCTLRPRHAGGRMAGAAVTVKTRASDILFVQKAFDIAGPGDVICVDGDGNLNHALMGEIMLAHATARGIAGVVINGAIRDAATVRLSQVPVFSVGVTHRGPFRNGPGLINVPIVLDNMVVNPGDLVLGDDDGVLVVPMDQAEAIYKAAHALSEVEDQQLADAQAGKLDRSSIDEALRKLGYID